MRHRIRRLHFVGIGGAGMCGLAEVMHNWGYAVSGSDIAESPALIRLREAGIDAAVGHHSARVANADAVVYSSAIPAGNPEIDAARQRGIPVVPRAQMLGELLRFKQGIAVAGTHGKTTITSMVAAVLGEAGMDPTCIVGGRLLAHGANARLGAGEHIIAEADESDASFLHLRPVIAVVSNIDDDHLDAYGQNPAELRRAFAAFLENLPFYGVAVLCFDDAAARECADGLAKRICSYAISADADYRADSIKSEGDSQRFILHSESLSGEFILHAKGRHNVQNALAAIAVGEELGAPENAIRKALAEFSGVGRRLEEIGECKIGGAGILLIDDYGHHPTEIAASLSALRESYSGRRLVLIFQPHRYTRTRDTFEHLADALSLADQLILTEVYPAGESPIVAADGESLCRAIRIKRKVEPIFVADLKDIPSQLKAVVQDGDLVATMGAGSIGGLARKIFDGGEK